MCAVFSWRYIPRQQVGADDENSVSDPPPLLPPLSRWTSVYWLGLVAELRLAAADRNLHVPLLNVDRLTTGPTA